MIRTYTEISQYEDLNVAQRIVRAIRQFREGSCLRHRTTHEQWLLAQKARAMTRAIREDGTGFEEADMEAEAWIITAIQSGESASRYTRQTYIDAGGDGDDYDDILQAQKEWIERDRETARLRAEYLKKHPEEA